VDPVSDYASAQLGNDLKEKGVQSTPWEKPQKSAESEETCEHECAIWAKLADMLDTRARMIGTPE